MTGVPKFAESQTIPDVSYAGFARSIGLVCVEVEKPDDIADASTTALSTDQPVVLDVHVDPDIPPIPPHATMDQMMATAKSLAKGEENRFGVIKNGSRPRPQEFLPHRDDGRTRRHGR